MHKNIFRTKRSVGRNGFGLVLFGEISDLMANIEVCILTFDTAKNIMIRVSIDYFRLLLKCMVDFVKGHWIYEKTCSFQ